jgi:DNA-binding GntR family transcriptional regulator
MKNRKTALQHIENPPLRERVLDVLREAIINGDLKPGDALRETELSESLGVSRAPLREALQILSTEGLVETVPYHGTTVRVLTKTDIEELYSLRSVLETFAVRQIIARNPPDHVQVLYGCFHEMLAAAENNDLKSVNQIDRNFHTTLIELSGHSLLQTSWNVVSMRVRQVMALLNRRNSNLTQIAYNHLPIIQAIEATHEQEAVRLIEKHVAASGELIVERWQVMDGANGT